MDLINSPGFVQIFVRGVAPLMRPFYRQILQIRDYKRSHRWMNTKKARDLADKIFLDYFKILSDPEKKQQLADLADKYKVREHVAKSVGGDVLTNLYGCWERPEDINFDALPVPCVLKTNNACAANLIIRDRNEIDPAKIRHKLASWLKFPYGDITGQPHYSIIKPLIIAEEFLQQDPLDRSVLPYDYKFFCFKGEPKFILFYSGRKVNAHFTYNMVYDTDWNLVEGIVRHPQNYDQPRPASLEKMTEMARKLAQGHDFVRVDFYNIGERVVFGELTFTPDVRYNFTQEFLTQSLALLQD